MQKYLILLAGGASTRFKQNKILSLINNQSLLLTVVRKFLKIHFKNIFLVCPKKSQSSYEEEIKNLNTKQNITFVNAGDKRQDSVYNALEFIKNSNELVFIHDVARAFISVELLKQLVTFVKNKNNVVLAKKAIDSLKIFDQESHSITKSLKRENICFTETPQVFKASDLYQAYSYVKENNLLSTDEASAVEL